MNMTSYSHSSDVDEGIDLTSLTKSADRLADAIEDVVRAERKRQRAIRDYGEIAGRPELAKRLIAERVTPAQALTRIAESNKRVTERGWASALALATGKRTVQLQNSPALAASWDRAIAAAADQRASEIGVKPDVGNGWDAAIKKVHGDR